MADENLGGIYFDVELDASNMLTAASKAKQTLDDIGSSATSASKRMDSLQGELRGIAQSANQTAKATTSVAGGMQTLNTSVSGVAQAMQQAIAIQNMQSISLDQLNAGMNSLVAASKSMAEAMASAGSSTTSSTQSYTRAQSAIESLGNQIAIMEEANENGARSAAQLAAQLRLGADASDAEKAKIAALTGTLYDMKNGTDTGAKSHGAWRSQMQQAGYQVQDFIVQVQGGQSALVAFSQQGSQLAGAFGPQGAIIGALIALGSVIVGTLVNSMGDATDTIKTLQGAANDLNNIITISGSGVAALSDKYALLASTNAKVGEMLKTEAIIQYNLALAKIPDAIGSVASSAVSVGDQLTGLFTGAIPSITTMAQALEDANIKTNSYQQAISSFPQTLGGVNAGMMTVANTVDTLSSNFGISSQQAFELAQRLNEVSQSKSPEALQQLSIYVSQLAQSTPGATDELKNMAVKLSQLSIESLNAAANLEKVKAANDALTASQAKAVQQSERNLALAKATGAERAKLQAQYQAEDLQIKQGSDQYNQLVKNSVATYNASQAQKNLTQQRSKANTAANQQARAEESIAQKLDAMRQKADLASISTEDLSLEQAKLQARLSLGKNATAAQIAESDRLTTSIWQQAAAIKARNLIPETKENDDYQKKQAQLDILKGQTDSNGKLLISQEQYQQQSEQLAQQHQENLAKIAAKKNSGVTPVAEARAEVDPVQQLDNQYAEQLNLSKQYQAQELAILQQANSQKIISNTQYQDAVNATNQQYLALRTAAENQYETARINAQWQILSNQSTVNQALTSGFDAVANSAGSALTGILTGTESVSDAMHNLVNSALNAVINSFVQAGAEWVKNIIIQQTMGSAASALSMTEATAVASAWAPAAALSSLATLGANAAPAQVGLGSTVGLAQGLALTGLRANGGPVISGGMYQVGENNKPEIYQTSTGSQFMIPGDGGRVLNQNQIGGGSSQPIINVHNYGSSQVSQNVRQGADGQTVIDFLIQDMDNGGPYHQQLQQNYGVSRKAQGEL